MTETSWKAEMRYALWSRGRLVGHTDLDIHTVTATMRQGFVEPTEHGRSLLADATGVWRAIAEMKRDARVRGEPGDYNHAIVLKAMERREALDLELRDDAGNLFECDFIRIMDIIDMNSGVVDEMGDTEEEEEARFQIELSGLSPEAREEALAHRAENDASIQADAEPILRDMQDERDEQEMFDSAWPPPPSEDPRWDTMQYLLQAHMKTFAWEKP